MFVSCLLSACGDNESGSSSSCTEHESTIDLAYPEVSFGNEVMPIIGRSCVFSSCHGAAGTGGLVLSRDDAGACRASLVDVVAEQLPSMKRVAPGDPQHSYLMRKVDGDACVFDAQCVAKSCKARMPIGSEALDATERDRIRRWIGQGARDN